MNKTLEDAKEAYQAWKEAQPGSYIESTMEHAIVRDLVPALILSVENGNKPTGFAKEER